MFLSEHLLALRLAKYSAGRFFHWSVVQPDAPLSLVRRSGQLLGEPLKIYKSDSADLGGRHCAAPDEMLNGAFRVWRAVLPAHPCLEEFT